MFYQVLGRDKYMSGSTWITEVPHLHRLAVLLALDVWLWWCQDQLLLKHDWLLVTSEHTKLLIVQLQLLILGNSNFQSMIVILVISLEEPNTSHPDIWWCQCCWSHNRVLLGSGKFPVVLARCAQVYRKDLFLTVQQQLKTAGEYEERRRLRQRVASDFPIFSSHDLIWNKSKF